jgi:alanyl aminopeptidase
MMYDHMPTMNQGLPLRVHAWLPLLALALAAPQAHSAPDPHRLGDDVRPVRQEVWLEINADEPGYRGHTTIELELTRSMAAFRLHAEGIEFESVQLKGEDFEAGLMHRPDSEGLVILSAPMVLAPGEYRLEIEFRNDFETTGVGLYRVEQGGQGYVFSQMQDIEARKSLPCFDEPGFKHPWQFTVRAPEEYLVVHNTPAESEKVADGWRETVFAETRPLPSYLIALASGPLVTVEMPELGVPGRIVLAPGQEPLAQLAVEMTGPILAALEEYFGEPYPFEKLDFISALGFLYGAMENPGAVVFLDRLLLVDPEKASVGQQRTLARVIAHELAHMWFGDVVTLAWWDDFWLNEAFADWLGDKIADRAFPALGIAEQNYASAIEHMQADGRASAMPVRSHYKASDDFTLNLALQYNKGKRVLAMFEQFLGEETFRKGIHVHIAAHRWGNASSDGLWDSLATATGTDIDRAISGFIDQPGLPLVRIERVKDELKLSQRRYSPHGARLPAQTWQVPVTLRFSMDDEEHEARLLLGPEPATLELPEGKLDWLVPNAGGAGYYHWQLEPALFDKLAAAPLTTVEQVERLANLGAMFEAGLLDGKRYFQALRQAGEQAEGVVLDQLLTRLEALREPFGVDHNGEAFRRYLRLALAPALEKVGAWPQSDEPEAVAAVRPRLLRVLGVEARDPAVAVFATELSQQYLDDPGSLDAELAMAVLQIYVIDGNAKLQRELKERAEAAADPVQRNALLAAFAGFHDPRRQQAALEYALSDALHPPEKWAQLMRAAAIPGQRDELLGWLFANYDAVTANLTREFQARMPNFAGGCSIARIARARQFFADPARRVSGTEHHLERTADAVRQCVALQQREATSVSAYLAQRESRER